MCKLAIWKLGMYEVIWLTRTDLADALINWQGLFNEKQDAHAAAGSLP